MFTLNAPAKINWLLSIVGKRADGYHDILSLMQCISLYDSITFEKSDRIEVITEGSIPLRENLVYKAASSLREKTSVSTGARISLHKTIPIAAGLGGGSSDAVHTLIGLNKLWGLKISERQILNIASSLGSDMPFFLSGPTAFVEGRGEKVTPLRLKKSYALLLLKPAIEVSTGWAYSMVGLTNKPNNPDNIKLLKSQTVQAIEIGDFPLLGSIAGNDFEAIVSGKYPVIKELKQRLTESGALFSAMSGSGPTVFGVFKDHKAAEDAQKANSTVWSRVVRTLTNGD